jgi:hypothetical protein
MATQIKVKVVRTPNPDFPPFDPEAYKDLEKNMENVMENQIENGWIYVDAAGGDSFIVLIFKKET